mmetsp:Transcript_29461/g.55139  ORF Transcript_29461/g.55139 Transcript_29461/m.55139 type:complete len:213 (-) Transcript_29461:346-984(-)
MLSCVIDPSLERVSQILRLRYFRPLIVFGHFNSGLRREVYLSVWLRVERNDKSAGTVGFLSRGAFGRMGLGAMILELEEGRLSFFVNTIAGAVLRVGRLITFVVVLKTLFGGIVTLGFFADLFGKVSMNWDSSYAAGDCSSFGAPENGVNLGGMMVSRGGGISSPETSSRTVTTESDRSTFEEKSSKNGFGLNGSVLLVSRLFLDPERKKSV